MQAAAPVAIAPFVRGAFKHVEPFFDVSNTIGATSVLVGPFDVPSYGYLRHIVLLVNATGGTGTAAVAREDAPFSVLQDITFLDVNGGQIWSGSGYDLYLANKYGAPVGGSTDPTVLPGYSAVATSGNFAFQLRIPIEVSDRDGFGALANMNSGQTYKVRITQAANVDVYSTNPTGAPSCRIRGFLEAWSAPLAQSVDGQAQATQPPCLGSGQFWSFQTFTIAAAGQQTLRLSRVGNTIRNIIAIWRTGTYTRATASYPDALSLLVDSVPVLSQEDRTYRQNLMRESLISTAPETGVFVYSMATDMDGLLGGEMRDQWMKTKSSTRLELQGNFTAPGTLRVLTNDLFITGDPYFS